MPSDQVDRYQLRPGHKDWSDHGPDLLRARDNVRHMLVRRLEDPLTGWFWRQRRGDDPDASEWEGPLKRVKVLAMFDAWAPERDGEAFQFGREVAEGIGHDVQWAVRFADVPLPEPGAPLETRVVAGLMRYAFPTMCPAGICVCKQIGRKVGDPVDPDAEWSTHAYCLGYDQSDADRCGGEGKQTEQCFDWTRRMALAGELGIWQTLGARDGSVVNAEAQDGWEVGLGGADDTHKWHVHVSVGSAPPGPTTPRTACT